MIDLSVVSQGNKLLNQYLWFRLATAAATVRFPSGSFFFSSTRTDARALARGDTFLLAERSEECERANASSRSALTHAEELMALPRPVNAAEDMGRKHKW